MDERKIYATYFGDETLPVEWKNDEEKDLMWFYDDLHCPNPISPLYYSVGGWWGPTCAYFYRRFGAPIGRDWIAKKIGGYLYTAVVPPNTDPDKVGGLFEYYTAVMDAYGKEYLAKWQTEFIPELKAAAEYMVSFDFENKSLAESMIHMEDCLDLQERAFRIHWMMNYAQVGASGAFQAVYKEAFGDLDDDYNQIAISKDDRNWDSLRELWKIKEDINKQPKLKEFFLSTEAEKLATGLKAVEGGDKVYEKIDAYRKEYGYKSIYTHEYVFKTWYEDPTPIYEAIKSYVETDYDFNTHYEGCMKTQREAIERTRGKITDKDLLARFDETMDRCVAMMPLTPDHHFYIDQSIYAHMRLMFLGIARAFVKAGKLKDPEDIFMLEYEEIRCLSASNYPVEDKIAQRRKDMEEAGKRNPRYWYGTVDHWQLYEELYKQILWGYPDIFEKEMEALESKEPLDPKVIKGVAGAAGVIEGVATIVKTPQEFDKLRKGDIMVCRMTNPGWIVSFSKIAGLVTDTGGALSHPAVVSREFGIPCVVGTARSSVTIKNGDRIRVDGDNGVVTILS
jgi:pyruvate,water dikinase